MPGQIRGTAPHPAEDGRWRLIAILGEGLLIGGRLGVAPGSEVALRDEVLLAVLHRSEVRPSVAGP